MQTKQHLELYSVNEEEADVYTFKRENKCWYICLPELLERERNKLDLQMVEGAHKFLNSLSRGAEKLRLRITTNRREDAAVLELVEHCEAPKAGAIYLFVPGKEENYSSLFWICDLALFVFGDMPERIYVQRLPVAEG